MNPPSDEADPNFKVGDIFRIPGVRGFLVWQITGLEFGAEGHENLVSLRRLDMKPGNIQGKTQELSCVPYEILARLPAERIQ